MNENGRPARLDSLAIRQADRQLCGGPTNIAFAVALGLAWYVRYVSAGACDLTAEKLGNQLATLDPFIGIAPDDSHCTICGDTGRRPTRHHAMPLRTSPRPVPRSPMTVP
jgi:hypothetical protein